MKDEYNYNKDEIDSIFKDRERGKLQRKLSRLESEEASLYNRITWNLFSLLIVDPLIAAATVWYLYSQIKSNLANLIAGNVANPQQIITNIKYTAIGIAIMFTLTSLGLIYHFWKLASVKSEKAEIARELVHNN